jgi:hypothetical protein
MADDVIDLVLSVPSGEVERVLGILSGDSGLDAETIPSAGAEGGGAFAAIVMTVSRRSIGLVTNTVKALVAGQDIKLQIGQTKFEGKRLRDPNLQALIEQVLEAELKRASGVAKRK